MQTEFSKEQELLRQIVASSLKERSTTEAVRELMASAEGYDPTVWRELCGDVGLAGIHLPESLGGSGLGAVELGIVAEQMGRYLFCGPFFASPVMAGYTLLEAAEEAHRAELLPGIASGETVATLVLDSLDGPDLVGRALEAQYVNGESRESSQTTLEGTAPIVLDAHLADLVLVIAKTRGEHGSGGSADLALYAVERAAAGMTVEPIEALDETRKLFRVSFREVPARRLGVVSREVLERLWDRFSVALAHEMIGGAQHLFDTTVEYTKVRVQFGRPIGSFQALKHRCADLLMELELARATTHYAARCLDSGEGEPYAASMAKAMASEAYMNCAKAAIQLRGGIGFTWEDDTHLWFKRAKSSEVFLGAPYLHRERMMSILEATA